MLSNIAACVLVKNDEYFLPYALQSTKGVFDRYVIYDVGSTDATLNIIDWFVETNKNSVEFYVKKMPHVDPIVQGTFRNSMIVDADRDWYWILDGDEVYNTPQFTALRRYTQGPMAVDNASAGRIFGVVKRIEVDCSLTQKYSDVRTHHRMYHRTAAWIGNHPGEESRTKQKAAREFHVSPDIYCYHMHNAMRSTACKDVPKRLERKSQNTYHPGSLTKWDLLAEVEILRKPIENFAVCPALEALQK